MTVLLSPSNFFSKDNTFYSILSLTSVIFDIHSISLLQLLDVSWNHPTPCFLVHVVQTVIPNLGLYGWTCNSDLIDQLVIDSGIQLGPVITQLELYWTTEKHRNSLLRLLSFVDWEAQTSGLIMSIEPIQERSQRRGMQSQMMETFESWGQCDPGSNCAWS